MESRYTAVLTGSGVSAESGIPTFRGKEGLWNKHRAEDLATPQAFKDNPKLVWDFYNWRRTLIHHAQINLAHKALVEMEETLKDFVLLTQNIDGLHRDAGSENIIELHGSIWEFKSLKDGSVRENRQVPIFPLPPKDESGIIFRPNVVWFGESIDPKTLEKAFEISSKCQYMIVIGTSAMVQPAAHLPLLAKRNGAYILEVNLELTPLSKHVDESLNGPAGVILPALAKSIAKNVLS
jgi:NAD-dependent deacetylase